VPAVQKLYLEGNLDKVYNSLGLCILD